jgi:hypothetical protein
MFWLLTWANARTCHEMQYPRQATLAEKPVANADMKTRYVDSTELIPRTCEIALVVSTRYRNGSKAVTWPVEISAAFNGMRHVPRVGCIGRGGAAVSRATSWRAFISP